MPILTPEQIAQFRTQSDAFADNAQATLDAYLAAIEEPVEPPVEPPITGDLPTVQPKGRLYDFTTGFVGWNVSWDRAGYPAARTTPQQCAAIPALIDRLRYTRVKLIRAGWPNPANSNFGAYKMMHDAGMRMIIVHPYNFPNYGALQAGFAHVSNMAADLPGYLYSIEGVNEYHTLSTQPPGPYKDRNGVTHAAGTDAAKVKHQEDLYYLANQNSATKDIPVTRFTFDQEVDNDAGYDYGNTHPYPKTEGETSQEGLTSLLPRRIRDIYKIRYEEWTKPAVITETGWTAPLGVGGPELDVDTQALCYQHAIYDAYKLGFKGIWIYELDNGDEARATQGFFGAYDRTGNSYSQDGIGYTATAKKSAHVVHNWMVALEDTNAADFALTGLPLKVSGLGALDEWMLFQKSDNSYRLLLVKRDDIWNKSSQPLNPASSTIKIEVAEGKQVAVCVPQDNETWSTKPAAASYSVTLTKKPVVVRIQ